jgi:hypothetical protein
LPTSFVIIADPETVFHLPTIKNGLHNFLNFSVGVIGDDDIFAEHRLFFFRSLDRSFRKLIDSPSPD